MPSFSLRKRFCKSRPALGPARETSDNQPPTGKYYQLEATMIPFADCFWPDATTVISDPARHINMRDEVAMNTIQTTLALLKEGSSLAAKFPFIAPIAGLLLQALTMRDVRVKHIPLTVPFSDECVSRK